MRDSFKLDYAEVFIEKDLSHSYGESIGDRSFVTGNQTVAASKDQFVSGRYNVRDEEDKYAHIVGNGTAENPSNAHTLDWSGNVWYAGESIKIGGTGPDDPNAKELATKDSVSSIKLRIWTSADIGGV